MLIKVPFHPDEDLRWFIEELTSYGFPVRQALTMSLKDIILGTLVYTESLRTELIYNPYVSFFSYLDYTGADFNDVFDYFIEKLKSRILITSQEFHCYSLIVERLEVTKLQDDCFYLEIRG